MVHQRRAMMVAASLALVVGASTATPVFSETSVEPAPETVDPEKVLSHLLCYRGVLGGFGEASAPDVNVADRFGGWKTTVGRARTFCIPVQKKKRGRVLSAIVSRRHHAKSYALPLPIEAQFRVMLVQNQFGLGEMQLFRNPGLLLVPTRKFPHKSPKDMDHYLCHSAAGGTIDRRFTLTDQFKRYKKMVVGKPVRFCAPAQKRHDGKTFDPRHQDVYLACYDVSQRELRPRIKVRSTNQFEKRKLNKIRRTAELCVPSLATEIK